MGQGRTPVPAAPILWSMPAQLDDVLATATLSDLERRTVRRLVAALESALGEDLLAVWLYGSRARGEQPHAESDVDLLVIAMAAIAAMAPR